MNVLFLTPWYPSDKDAMSGLFVLKHVEAVRAQGCEVRVIHSQGWCDTWHQWKALQREGWRPDIVQLNVIQKQGLLALWLKRKHRIPYVIVEHWSGFLPENGAFAKMSVFKRRFYQLIVKKAAMILTVSEPLQRAMKAHGLQARQWGMIDNVVDDFFLDTSISQRHSKQDRNKVLLYVGCFDERAKNVKGLLRAAKMLSEKRQDWQLVIVGTGVDYKEVREYAEALALPANTLRWTGELTPQQVAEEMHRADAFVLSSRYETYGIVLAEAATAGLPILSTPVGIAKEVEALLVPQEIAQHKAGTFAEFIESILFNNESRKAISQRDRFSANSIGKKLTDIYDRCLHHDI